MNELYFWLKVEDYCINAPSDINTKKVVGNQELNWFYNIFFYIHFFFRSVRLSSAMERLEISIAPPLLSTFLLPQSVQVKYPRAVTGQTRGSEVDCRIAITNQWSLPQNFALQKILQFWRFFNQFLDHGDWSRSCGDPQWNHSEVTQYTKIFHWGLSFV